MNIERLLKTFLVPVLISFAVSSNLLASDFSAPYSTSVWWLAQADKETVEPAFATIAERLALAKTRIVESQTFLNNEAIRYGQVARNLQSRGKHRASQFYFSLEQIIKTLPERNGLAAQLREFEREHGLVLQEFRSVFDREAEAASRRFAAGAAEETIHKKQEIYRRWLQVLRTNDLLERYFTKENLSSQGAFNLFLLKTAVPFFAVNAQGEGAKLAALDWLVVQFVNRDVRRGFFSELGFLSLSLSPQWSGANNNTYHRVFGLQPGSRQSFIEVVPQFHAYEDRDVITKILEGGARATTPGPLCIRTTKTSDFWAGLSPLAWRGTDKPVYNPKRHELILPLGPFKGNWGSAVCDIAASSGACAALLRQIP